MEFRLLGPFEARHEGRQVLTGARRQERCLLAVLLLRAGRVVTTGHLIDLLWSGGAPANARGTVHTYIGRLRAALRPFGGPELATREDGYRVVPGTYRLDTAEFTALVRQAGAARDPGTRADLYDRALGLWRGPLLDGTADGVLRERLGGELAELRLSALERRAEAQLAMGRHDRVAADLAPHAGEHPEREQLVAAQMTALYRGGRQAEALRLYRGTRRALVDGLGIEPGAALASLHDRILRGDPQLNQPQAPAPVYAVRVGEEWLPWSAGGHPALELCNTYAGWGGQALPGGEWLRRYATLAVWAGHHDLAAERLVAQLLARAGREPAAAAAVLAEAQAFRARLYACLTDPADAASFAAVAAVVERAAAVSSFTRDEDGLGHWRLTPAAGLRLPLYAAARAAGELLADPRRFTIRACPGENCGWLFLDASGRRRWCSLATCGAGCTAP
ncbi:BTAD domain-containing putative transcriptional regulator [Streptomyces sp. DSM 41886]|uniref:BTAD domain-containing putative transcriptional regulator n=1 Tax=Streptomyces johnsoniae TaxID=3075532 RepID=A0ABU2S9J1_9ACTN|nr:BTAD domain-containing putative transcriptional regulator [Streptomyces sp. DSM 41886]MDT0445588.1 BTAD domain-containing putative transcriptional regulator [Streptomyces sp. DSM 41886]